MRAGVLSDPKIIAQINRDYVPLDLDVSSGKVPSALMPALLPMVERVSNVDFRDGLATAVVIEPGVRWMIACSGCGHQWERFVSVNYDGAKFTKFLQDGLQRYARIKEIDALDPVQRTAATVSFGTELYKTVTGEATCHMPNPQ